jgi:hypothetical protein
MAIVIMQIWQNSFEKWPLLEHLHQRSPNKRHQVPAVLPQFGERLHTLATPKNPEKLLLNNQPRNFI